MDDETRSLQCGCDSRGKIYSGGGIIQILNERLPSTSNINRKILLLQWNICLNLNELFFFFWSLSLSFSPFIFHHRTGADAMIAEGIIIY